MRAFHVTYYENLDSILANGLEARDTTENNFPRAYDNRGKAVFFMPDLRHSNSWYRNFHPKDFRVNPDGFAEDCDRGDSVIIEFEIPEDCEVFEDPYGIGGSTYSLMSYARFVCEDIPPENIIDIHSPWAE